MSASRKPILALPFTELPLELAVQIRQLLEPGDVLTCMQVCRSWQYYLNNKDNLVDLINAYQTHDLASSARPKFAFDNQTLRAVRSLEDRQLMPGLEHVLWSIRAHHRGIPYGMLRMNFLRSQFHGNEYNPLLVGARLLHLVEPFVATVEDLISGMSSMVVFRNPVQKTFAMTSTHLAVAQGSYMTIFSTIDYLDPEIRCGFASLGRYHHETGMLAVAAQGDTFVAVYQAGDILTQLRGYHILLATIDSMGSQATTRDKFFTSKLLPAGAEYAVLLLHDEAILLAAAYDNGKYILHLSRLNLVTGTSTLVEREYDLTSTYHSRQTTLTPTGRSDELVIAFFGHKLFACWRKDKQCSLRPFPHDAVLWKGRMYRRFGDRIYSARWPSLTEGSSFSAPQGCSHAAAGLVTSLTINDSFLISSHRQHANQHYCQPYQVYSFDKGLIE